MPLLLIPFLAGASTTGYAWWQSESEDNTPKVAKVGFNGVTLPFATIAVAVGGYFIFKKLK